MASKSVNVFVVLACHQPELDGFNQHFQVTVQFSPSTTGSLSLARPIIFPPKKIQECWESNPGLLSEKQACCICAMQLHKSVIDCNLHPMNIPHPSRLKKKSKTMMVALKIRSPDPVPDSFIDNRVRGSRGRQQELEKQQQHFQANNSEGLGSGF